MKARATPHGGAPSARHWRLRQRVRRRGTVRRGAPSRISHVTSCRPDDFLIDKVERGTKDNPLDHILVAFAKSLPYGFLFGGTTSDSYAGSSTATFSRNRIFLDATELDTLGRNQVAGIRKVEHGPPSRVGVRLGDLEQGLIVTRSVGVRQRELVHGCMDTRVGDSPFEVPRGFAEHGAVARGTGRSPSTIQPSRTRRRHRLGNAKVTLHGRGQKVRLLVVVGVDIRIQDVLGLTMRGHNQRRQVVRHRRMVRRSVYSVCGWTRQQKAKYFEATYQTCCLAQPRATSSVLFTGSVQRTTLQRLIVAPDRCRLGLYFQLATAPCYVIMHNTAETATVSMSGLELQRWCLDVQRPEYILASLSKPLGVFLCLLDKVTSVFRVLLGWYTCERHVARSVLCVPMDATSASSGSGSFSSWTMVIKTKTEVSTLKKCRGTHLLQPWSTVSTYPTLGYRCTWLYNMWLAPCSYNTG